MQIYSEIKFLFVLSSAPPAAPLQTYSPVYTEESSKEPPFSFTPLIAINITLGSSQKETIEATHVLVYYYVCSQVDTLPRRGYLTWKL